MEKAAQPTYEKLKSFDPLASVDMMQFDLQRFGQIMPETMARVMDEELSNLSEAVDRATRTEFVLKREEGQLVYFDRGGWRPYVSTLTRGLKVAEAEAQADPRREFLARRAVEDLKNGYKMQGLQKGETHAWYSAFPLREAERYGADFIQKCGFKPDRKMGFLYMAECDQSGNVVLHSQSVDNSDEDAFKAAMSAYQYDPEADIETLRRAYDGYMSVKFDRKFYAGRLNAEHNENAWEAINKHRALAEYLVDGLEQIANYNLPRHELEQITREHVYGTWALFKKCLDGYKPSYYQDAQIYQYGTYDKRAIALEANLALCQFAAMGKAMIGCGGSIEIIKSAEDLLSMSGEDAFNAIFGSRGEKEEKYTFGKYMYCVVCQAPPKKQENKKMCGPCGICRSCDSHLKAKSK